MLGTVPFAGAALKDRFDLDYLSIGLILGSFGVGGLIYSLLVRLLVRALGERRMVIAGGACVAAGYALLALGPAWQWFVPALALIGGGFFTMHGTLMTRGTELAPQARGTAMSGFSTSLFVGQALGTFAGGLLIDGAGYALAFGIPAAGTLLLAVRVYRVLPRFPRARN
jgi:predicted MFS family arabinose efflux permease